MDLFFKDNIDSIDDLELYKKNEELKSASDIDLYPYISKKFEELNEKLKDCKNLDEAFFNDLIEKNKKKKDVLKKIQNSKVALTAKSQNLGFSNLPDF